MKNKKGFTLIELLAVIVILAIIALIAVPTIMNVINKANKSAFKDTAYGIISAGELYFAEQQLELNGMSEDEEFVWPDDIKTLQVKGNVPDGTVLQVNTNGETALAMSNGRYCVTKGYSDKDISITEEFTDCKIPTNGTTLSDLAVVAPDLGVNSVDECAFNGECEAGTAFAIKVNDEQTYKFYVLTDSYDTITLIMPENLGNTVAWYGENVVCDTYEEDHDGDGVIDDSWKECSGDTSYGPLTALEALKTRTSSWTNLEEYSYTLDYGRGTYSGEYVQNVRAKLPSLSEIEGLGCEEWCVCPEWMYEGFSGNGNNEEAYWLSDASTTSLAWVISNDGGVYDGGVNADRTVGYSDYAGIRPVITLSGLNRASYKNGTMKSYDNCINEGTCAAGTAVYVDVNEKETYKFYVLNDDGDTMNLIMYKNLGEDVAWHESGDDAQGPLTALEALKTRASNWTNLEEYSYTLDYGSGTYSGEYVQNVRARMVSLADITADEIGCTEGDTTCPTWLNGDYWLSDVSSSSVWYMSYGLLDNAGPLTYEELGLRPVITMTK